MPSDTAPTGPGDAPGEGGTSSAASRALALAPWALVATLLAVLAWRASAIVDAMRSNADLAAPLALAHVLGDAAPGAAAVTGNYGWWNGLWAVQALHPLGDTIASFLPLAGTVVAIASLTVQAARLLGARAAVAVPLVAGAVTADAWIMAAAWSGRAPNWWAMVAFGLLLVAHADGAFLRHPRAMQVATVAVVAWAGAALSGDSLMWVVLVAPGVGVAGASLVAGRPRAGAFPLAAAGAIALLSVAVRQLASAAGYYHHAGPVGRVPFEDGQDGFGVLTVALQTVWGSDVSVASAAAGYLGAALVLTALAGGVAVLAGTLSKPGGRAEAASPVTTWAVFWTSVIVATCVAYAFSTATTGDDGAIPRYLYGLPFATGALLALLATRVRARALVLAPASVLAILGVVTLADRRPPLVPAARLDALPAISTVARQYGATRGYASYWSAYPLSVRSGYALDVTPVGQCPDPGPVRLCPMYLHYVDRALAPRPAIRSFLLVDFGPGSRGGAGSDWVTSAPAGITPIASVPVASALQMVVYDHDIAADLGDHTILGEPIRHDG